jgi:cytochrome c
MAEIGDKNESFEAKDFGWMVAMSVLFFALVVVGFWFEFSTDWGSYQREFPQLLSHYGKVEDARDFRAGIKQIWIPKIGVTDRCITCHLGYEWSSVLPATIAEPLKPHTMNDWLAKHEFERFGCTPCHGGDGSATTLAGSHQGGKGWEDPMLSRALAERNGLTMNEMMQMRCNFCHRRDAATPGMDEINLAKKLVVKKKCLICHTVEGRGGNTGPELTYEGDKNPELLSFAHVTGERTMFTWNVQHLTQASVVTPNTQMPDFNMQPEESRALTLLLLSWRRLPYPPEYIPDPELAAAAMQPSPSPASSATPAPAATPIAR